MNPDAELARAAQDAGGRDVPLKLESEQFRELGHALVDRVAELLRTLPQRPVTSGAAPEVVRAALRADAPLPQAGSPASDIIAEAVELLLSHSLYNGHPRFFGYITASPAPIGILADMLAAAVNANLGGWLLSPVATEIEAQTVRWIAEFLGYDTGCGGLLVSGGNMANLVAFWAARAATAPWDVRGQGLTAPGARRLRVYASTETHTWLQKATDLAGFGTDAVRWIDTDGGQRMDVTALRAAIERDRAAGEQPMLVVGNAGTVSTGAVDALTDIAALCREQQLWFHVDGAYGGFAAGVPGAPAELRGIALADSVAVDPHKWLYAPLEAGCVLVRDPAKLRAAFSYHPLYYHFASDTINYVDFGPQNSRGFRALKVWLALRHAGRAGYERMIGDDIALSERLYRHVVAHPELEPLTQNLSITTFRYVPVALRAEVGTPAAERHLDTLNRELLDRLQRSGEAFVSNAVIGGIYALRACIVNFNTGSADVDALPEIVARAGRQIHAELGSAR